MNVGIRDGNNIRYSFGVLWLSLVVSWPFGVDQLFPPIVAFIFCFLFAVKTKRWPSLSRGWATPFVVSFLFFFLLSGLSLSDFSRLITFSRDGMIWVTSLVFYLIFSSARFDGDFRAIGKSFLIFVLILMATSSFYILFPSFSFKSFAYHVVPDSISNTMMGSRNLIKSFGEQLYFMGFESRVSSIFGSPIHLACLVILLYPFCVQCIRSKISSFVFYVACFLVLFFAQARLAMVVFLLIPLVDRWIKLVVYKNKDVFSALLFVAFFVTVSSFAILYGQQIIDFLYDLFIERRKGSAEARGSIYALTISGIFDSPIIGHATQQDHPGLDYPLGSHSTPLGLVFKHGPIAALLMLCVMGRALFLGVKLIRAKSRAVADFSTLWVASYGAYLVLMVVNEFIVDVYHSIILFSVFALIEGIYKYHQSGLRQEGVLDRVSRG